MTSTHDLVTRDRPAPPVQAFYAEVRADPPLASAFGRVIGHGIARKLILAMVGEFASFRLVDGAVVGWAAA